MLQHAHSQQSCECGHCALNFMASPSARSAASHTLRPDRCGGNLALQAGPYASFPSLSVRVRLHFYLSGPKLAIVLLAILLLAIVLLRTARAAPAWPNISFCQQFAIISGAAGAERCIVVASAPPLGRRHRI